MSLYLFEQNDKLLNRALDLQIIKPLQKKGYVDINRFISGKKRKVDYFDPLKNKSSKMSRLYKMPYPDLENVKQKWEDFLSYYEGNNNELYSISELEAEAILYWIFSVYRTDREQNIFMEELLMFLNQKLNNDNKGECDNEAKNAHGLIYIASRININLISSVEEYIQNMESIQQSEYSIYYRGHSDCNFALLPSIMRSASWKEHECDMYNEVIIECPSAFSNCNSHLDYLVEMQHYGLPTRLLDVTRNPLVALYFSCLGEPETNAEVIVFAVAQNQVRYPKSDTVSILASLPRINNKIKNELFQMGKDTNCDNTSFNTKALQLLQTIKQEKPAFQDHINKQDITNCFFVQAEKKNARIIKQDGAFIICGLLSEENNILDSYRYKQDDKIQIYIIVNKAKERILEQLEYMSINRAQLFPEIQDVALHIKEKY